MDYKPIVSPAEGITVGDRNSQSARVFLVLGASCSRGRRVLDKCPIESGIDGVVLRLGDVPRTEKPHLSALPDGIVAHAKAQPVTPARRGNLPDIDRPYESRCITKKT